MQPTENEKQEWKAKHTKLGNDIIFENSYCIIAQCLDIYLRFDKVTGQVTRQKEYFNHAGCLIEHPSHK